MDSILQSGWLARLKEALLTSADGEASPRLEEILSAELVARPKVIEAFCILKFWWLEKIPFLS